MEWSLDAGHSDTAGLGELSVPGEIEFRKCECANIQKSIDTNHLISGDNGWVRTPDIPFCFGFVSEYLVLDI